MSDIVEKRKARVEAAVARIREIENSQGVNEGSLDAIRAEMLALADPELFPLDHFPVGENGADRTYRLSEDPDGRIALYACSGGPIDVVQPHNHKTWAVITGIQGCERNWVYDAEMTSDDPVRMKLTESKEIDIVPGEALALMPLDIHSIQFIGEEPTLTLHMYGYAIDKIDDRAGYDLKSEEVSVFPATADIEPPVLGA